VRQREKRVEEVARNYMEDMDKLMNAQITKSSKLVMFRMCVNHQLLFYMFVDNSSVTDWEEADHKMLSFFRTIMNLPNLEK